MDNKDIEILNGIRKENKRKEDIEQVKDRYFIIGLCACILTFCLGIYVTYGWTQSSAQATCHLLDAKLREYNVSYVMHNESDLSLLVSRAQNITTVTTLPHTKRVCNKSTDTCVDSVIRINHSIS